MQINNIWITNLQYLLIKFTTYGQKFISFLNHDIPIEKSDGGNNSQPLLPMVYSTSKVSISLDCI